MEHCLVRRGGRSALPPNFDQLALAEKLRKHDLLEFRRIAAALYKKNKKWKQSVELSKKDKMYKDAMETVAESEDKDLTEELLRFFVDNGLSECFAPRAGVGFHPLFCFPPLIFKLSH